MTISQTQLRLRIYGAPQLSVQTILTDLAENCRVGVRALSDQGSSTRWSIDPSTAVVEIELSGPLEAVQCWLQQIQHYPLTIRGKGNPDGDTWHD